MGWYNQAWHYRDKIVVPASNIYGPFSDLRMLITGDHFTRDLWANAQDTGGDIVVTLADGVTEAPREVAYFDPNAKRMELWVKAPQSYHADNIFYVYYGNSLVDKDAAPSVWSGYEAVYHFADDLAEASSLLDSSGNGHDAAIYGTLYPTFDGYMLSYLDELNTPDTAGAHSLDVLGNIAVVAGKAGVVSIIDISDPSNLQQFAGFNDGGSLKDAQQVNFIDSTHVFIGAFSQALVLDISDPNRPVKIASFTDFDGPLNGGDITPDGKWLFGANKGLGDPGTPGGAVSGAPGSIEVFDVSDPDNVTHAASFTDPDGDAPHDCKVSEDGKTLIYVCKQPDDVKQVAALDITTPASPTTSGTLSLPNFRGTNQLQVMGGYAYIACNYDYAVIIVDISDPTNLVLLDSDTRLFEPDGIALDRKRKQVFVSNDTPNASNSYEITVFDISNPVSLNLVQQFEKGPIKGGHQLAVLDDVIIQTAGGAGTRYYQSVNSISRGTAVGQGCFFKNRRDTGLSTNIVSMPVDQPISVSVQAVLDNNRTDQTLVAKWDSSDKQVVLDVVSDRSVLRFAVCGSSGVTAEATWDITEDRLDTLLHITGRWSPTRQKVELVINGELVDAQDVSFSTLQSSSNNLCIGFDSSHENLLYGLLDEVRIAYTDWPLYGLRTEYNNQRWPRDFYRLEPEAVLKHWDGKRWAPVASMTYNNGAGLARVG